MRRPTARSRTASLAASFIETTFWIADDQPKEVTVVDALTIRFSDHSDSAGPAPARQPDASAAITWTICWDYGDRTMPQVLEAEYTLTPDEKAVRSRSHGIAVANDGKEVWSNDVVHNLTFVFDVTVSPPKQIARFAVGRQPYWIVPSKDSKTIFVACPSSDELIAFDVLTKKEKGRIQFAKGSHPTRMLVVAAPRGAQPHSR